MSACEAAHLRRRYRAIAASIAYVTMLGTGLMLVPWLSAFIWPGDRTTVSFLLPALLIGAGSFLVWRYLRPAEPIALNLPEGGVVVLLSWVLVCLFSAWPFLVTGLTFTQAMFESVSGWTTTGLSVVDVTTASYPLLLWRSLMQLAGGAGLAIIMLSALTGPTGPALSTAEGREQLVPHVRQSAILVMTIYSAYAIVGTIGLTVVGMSVFDAINHAFAAISTGGFSTRAASIGHWDSVAVEAVTIPLMILGNLSFVTAWLILRGRTRAAINNAEVRLFCFLVPVCALLIFGGTARALYPSLEKSVRVALFETITALTTTGFSTVGYGDWNSAGWAVMLLLMFIGGGTCSTAGGIKQYRVYLLWRSAVWHLRSLMLPRTAIQPRPVWEGESQVFVSDTRLAQIGTFIFAYFLIYAVGVVIVCAYGYSLKEAAFEFASSLGTVGLSVGVTGPATPVPVLWTQTVAMFLGRLEIFVVLASLFKLVGNCTTMLKCH